MMPRIDSGALVPEIPRFFIGDPFLDRPEGRDDRPEGVDIEREPADGGIPSGRKSGLSM